MEYLGLVFEILILVFAVYLYLFSRGMIKAKTAEAQKKADKFREDNATWMRFLSLALIAVMLVNIMLHIKQLWA